MKNIILLSLVCFAFTSSAQDSLLIHKKKNFVDLGVGFAKKEQIISAAFYHNWYLSKEKKVLKNIFIGTGLRFTGFFGKDVNFTSAPPSLYGTKDADSLFAPTPFIYSVNAFINLGYNITPKWQIGFDLDAIGFSFGPKGTPRYIDNGVETIVGAKPTSVNLLLIGANDKGTLNGGLYVRYKITNNFAVRLSYHTLFVELTTDQKVQTIPELNDRFRHGANPIGIGFSYFIN